MTRRQATPVDRVFVVNHHLLQSTFSVENFRLLALQHIVDRRFPRSQNAAHLSVAEIQVVSAVNIAHLEHEFRPAVQENERLRMAHAAE